MKVLWNMDLFAIFSKYVESDGVAVQVVNKKIYIYIWLLEVDVSVQRWRWYYYGSYWHGYASEWWAKRCFRITTEFRNKFMQ